MKRNMGKVLIGLSVLILSAFGARSFFAAGTIIYVPDQYATIQQAIDAAAAGDTVMVRNGTYKLTTALDFKGKAITVISENGASNCFLDGQLQTRLVYFHSGEGNGSVLSGFTIQNGKATQGGGIYLSASSPKIEKCTISANKVTAWAQGTYTGGGIFSEASSPIIDDCIIQGNSATKDPSYCCTTAYGGGIYINGGAPVITNSVVSGNYIISGDTIAKGGGIYSNSSSVSIINTTIYNNSATATSPVTPSDTRGGGLYFLASTPILTNCIISGNSSMRGAGIYFDQSSAFSNLTNCTISRNTASTNGGGLYCANTSPKIINSILWEDSPQEVFNETTSSNPSITYSDVLGGYSGTGNINALPHFVNIAQQDYHLMPGSPCIDAGSNAAPYLPNQDKDGRARINGGGVDMGAYEYFSTILLLNNSRFAVQVDWSAAQTGQSGHGTAVPLTSDSGYFWFFGGNNVELLVKILDGRGVNNHYWFFWGAMTDVQYDIKVTDTQTGTIKHYYGFQGVQQSGNDITAF